MRFPEFSGEWEQYRLGDLVEIRSGVSPSGVVEDIGEFPFYKVEQLNNCHIKLGATPYWTKQSAIPADSIVFPKRGAAIMTNKIRISTQPCQIDTNLMALTVVNNEKFDFKFIYHFIDRCNLSKIADTSTIPQINNIHINPLKIRIPSFDEQKKISTLFTILDERIATQIKVIEDLKKLKSAITHSHFENSIIKYPARYIGDCIEQVSRRNKNGEIDNVLSVSNKSGFITQSEQFEDREIASEDTTNYKVVRLNDFAYNPARINVGSIARLQSSLPGIVSPMYVCFRTSHILLPEYFEHFFATQYFKHEMHKRLEGSVRLCLTFDSLCNIKIALPPIETQKQFSQQILALENKVRNEMTLLSMYQSLKQYFLSQMFI